MRKMLQQLIPLHLHLLIVSKRAVPCRLSGHPRSPSTRTPHVSSKPTLATLTTASSVKVTTQLLSLVSLIAPLITLVMFRLFLKA